MTDDDDKPLAEMSRDELLWEYDRVSSALNGRGLDEYSRRELGERAAALRKRLGGDA